MTQHVIGQLACWCGVQHDDGVVTSEFYSTLHDSEADFKLHQHHLGVCQQRCCCVNVVNRQCVVGARHHDDEILGIVRHANQRPPSWFAHRGEQADIDCIMDESCTQGIACSIATDSTNECCTRTGPRRSNRLIGTLATAGLEIIVGRHRLTGMRESHHACH